MIVSAKLPSNVEALLLSQVSVCNHRSKFDPDQFQIPNALVKDWQIPVCGLLLNLQGVLGVSFHLRKRTLEDKVNTLSSENRSLINCTTDVVQFSELGQCHLVD